MYLSKVKTSLVVPQFKVTVLMNPLSVKNVVKVIHYRAPSELYRGSRTRWLSTEVVYSQIHSCI